MLFGWKSNRGAPGRANGAEAEEIDAGLEAFGY